MPAKKELTAKEQKKLEAEKYKIDDVLSEIDEGFDYEVNETMGGSERDQHQGLQGYLQEDGSRWRPRPQRRLRAQERVGGVGEGDRHSAEGAEEAPRPGQQGARVLTE